MAVQAIGCVAAGGHGPLAEVERVAAAQPGPPRLASLGGRRRTKLGGAHRAGAPRSRPSSGTGRPRTRSSVMEIAATGRPRPRRAGRRRRAAGGVRPARRARAHSSEGRAERTVRVMDMQASAPDSEAEERVDLLDANHKLSTRCFRRGPRSGRADAGPPTPAPFDELRETRDDRRVAQGPLLRPRRAVSQPLHSWTGGRGLRRGVERRRAVAAHGRALTGSPTRTSVRPCSLRPARAGGVRARRGLGPVRGRVRVAAFHDAPPLALPWRRPGDAVR